MGIIATDIWLQNDLDHPFRLCENLLPYFKGDNESGIYNQLKGFGMYRPSRDAKHNFEFMRKQKTWEKVDGFYQKYKKKWSGPDIPIFIFPFYQPGGLFVREKRNKGGVSYPDKMFLFLSKIDDEQEIEALFVHEYHHVCRLNKLKKNMDEYSLLDSIVIEGLAEYAVLKNCGRKYLANWCTKYTDKELIMLWNRYLRDYLTIEKSDKAHNQRLFGGGGIPNLLGYAAGFALVEEYYNGHRFSTESSFSNPSKKYMEAQKKFNG